MFKLAVFLTLVAVAYARSNVEEWANDFGEVCMSEANIQGETLASLTAQFENEESDIVPALKCFYKCLNEKMHLQDSNGVLTPRDYILFLGGSADVGAIDESKVQEAVAMISICANSNVEDLCERSVKIVQCVEREWLNKP